MIEGAISVKAVIKAGKRDIEKLYISKNKKTKDFNYIRKLAKQNNIETVEMDSEQISELLSGKSHGGIGLLAGKRNNDEFENGDIFFLDGIEDPFNLGYCLRTLYAFGIKNVLLSQRDYTDMEMQLLKSSAGAYELLNIKIIEDEIKDISYYKDNGYHIYGLYRSENSKDVFDQTFKDKSLFILGGEKRGISSKLLELCDEHLYISYGSDFRNALNACAALDVVATLLYSQRRKQ